MSLVQRILLIGKGPGLRAQLFRGGLGSVILKLTGMVLMLVIAIVLARHLGPEGYGVYTYVLALISMLAIPAQFGLPNLIVRETAKAQTEQNWSKIKGLWRWSFYLALAFSISLALLGGVAALMLSERYTSQQLTTFTLGLLLIPLIALGSLRGAALRGLRYVVQGQLPEYLLLPGGLILGVLLILWFGESNALTASQVMLLHIIAAIVAFVFGATLLWRARPVPLKGKITPEYCHSEWLASIIPMAFVSGMGLINKYTDTIMLGWFADIKDVGIYTVAVNGAVFVVFGLQSANLVVGPYFARFHAQNDKVKLQKIVTFSSRIIFAMALPVVLVLVTFGGHILHFVFGELYVSAALALAILAIGQLVNASMGSVGFLLTMTGNEKVVARGVAISAVVNVILNLLFIPEFGMNGAASATAVSLVVWNIILWYEVRTRLGLASTVFKF